MLIAGVKAVSVEMSSMLHIPFISTATPLSVVSSAAILPRLLSST